MLASPAQTSRYSHLTCSVASQRSTPPFWQSCPSTKHCRTYEPPTNPEVEVNTEHETLEESVEKVLDTLRQRGFLSVAQATSAR